VLSFSSEGSHLQMYKHRTPSDEGTSATDLDWQGGTASDSSNGYTQLRGVGRREPVDGCLYYHSQVRDPISEYTNIGLRVRRDPQLWSWTGKGKLSVVLVVSDCVGDNPTTEGIYRS